MGLSTVLVILVLNGRRNLTTLALVPLICFAVAKIVQFEWKKDTNEVFLVSCLLLYFAIFLFIVICLPNSFTLGEMMVVAQTMTILLIDNGISIYSRLRFVFPSSYYTAVTNVDELPFARSEVTFVLQTFVVGTLITGLLLLPVFYYLSIVSEPAELWIGCLSFYAICLLSFMSVFLPSFYITLGGVNPVLWAVKFLSLNPTRIRLIIYWFAIVLLSFAVVVWKSSYHEKKDDRPLTPNIIVRKIFHILAVAIFIPGILYDPSLLHMCSSVATSLFLFIEFIRFGRIKPFGEMFHRHLSPLIDQRDSGPLILTHVYLLTGCALPLWLFPLDYHKLSQNGCNLLLYSGVLSIGVGDAAASVFGVKFGKHRWKGTTKTVEGTLASCLSQFFVIFLLKTNGMDMNLVSVGLAVVLSSLLEAFTSQIDNLVLPLYTYTVLAMTCAT
ncbi:dolichol kinase-like isoform X2 [Dendronephthya gigantea]|nr:dolichol kinase-like isoform X2 [Dendronephthya gigantea]